MLRAPRLLPPVVLASLGLLLSAASAPLPALRCPKGAIPGAFGADGGAAQYCALPGRHYSDQPSVPFMHGPFRANYPAGPLEVEASFAQGLLEGTVRYYHRNGKKKLEGQFHLARPVGRWTA